MSDIAKKEKKQKKDKKRKHEEDEAEEQPQPVKQEATEEEGSSKAKKEKKAKKAKKESSGSDNEAESGAAASTSAALNDLADELLVDQSGAAVDDEPIDLLALKKNKGGNGSKATVHASRAGADDAARADAASFKPDANAEVISDKVRLFLGNLPFKVTDELIHECFDEFGEIAGIHWVTDKATGKFYGTAFVDFVSADAAKAALVRNGVEILGRAIKVNYATGANVASAKRFNSKEKKGAHLAKQPISEKPEGCNTVFLGNLSFEVDESTIRDVFKECGDISDIRWVEKEGQFLGCGFVEFAESWSTDEAVKCNGMDVLGRPMRVDYSARTSRPR